MNPGDLIIVPDMVPVCDGPETNAWGMLSHERLGVVIGATCWVRYFAMESVSVEVTLVQFTDGTRGWVDVKRCKESMGNSEERAHALR